MLQKGFQVIIIAILFLFSAIANGKYLKSDMIEDLYVKSGLEIQIKQIPSIIQSGIDQAINKDTNNRKLPRRVISNIKELIPQSFAPEIIKKEIIKHIENQMNITDIKSSLKWLNSPLGKKFTKLEEVAATPEAIIEMQKYAATIQKSPPSAERIKIIRKLDSAMKATETSTEIVTNVQLAVATAVLMSLPVEKRKAFSQIREEVEKSRPHIEKAMRSQIMLSFLYTYKTSSDSEINQYIGFAISEAGQKYHTSSIDAFKNGFIKSCMEFGKSIAAILENKNNQSEI